MKFVSDYYYFRNVSCPNCMGHTVKWNIPGFVLVKEYAAQCTVETFQLLCMLSTVSLTVDFIDDFAEKLLKGKHIVNETRDQQKFQVLAERLVWFYFYVSQSH